ncbi:YjdJ family protein [Metabacillus fastidiosus]|uniref:YjdJ family protein n=1 Tax=Metabacillus fastidiosus TaxID=1458 RepID=UPI003D299D6E
MKLHYFIQLGTSLLFFSFSTFAAWYEGSALLDNEYEWKYTAKFTYWLKGEPTNYKDIMQIDYFVYAAKFRPLFIWLMIISIVYFLIIISIIIKKYLKDNKIIDTTKRIS